MALLALQAGWIRDSLPDEDLLMNPYAATEGDLASPQPGTLDVLGRAKWSVQTYISYLL